MTTSKIWLALESVKPLRWAIRYGGKWRIVKEVKIEIPMETRKGKIAPHGYLFGIGKVIFKESVAFLRNIGDMPFRPRK